MSRSKVVSRDEWLIARKEFLKQEKEFTYERERLSEARRKLPMVEIEKTYLFDSNLGEVTLAELFKNHQQLIIYHFMYGKDWQEGCPSCSFWADNFNGISPHLAARNTAFAVISNAPLEVLNKYAKRLDWNFNWLSAGKNSFSTDFGVSFYDDAETSKDSGYDAGYNYSDSIPDSKEMPGISVFFKQDDKVFHSYSTYGRGLDMLNGAYHYLDLTPLGRDEAELPFTQSWVNRHDEY